MQYELGSKILITFNNDIAYKLIFPGNWYEVLSTVLRQCKPYVGMCVFKTFIGAWTTSSRMSEPVCRPCLLGCTDGADNINHYIQCSPLWQIARSALGIVDPFEFSNRLCLVAPTPGNAQLLALVYTLYHNAHNTFSRDGVSPSPRATQKNLVEASRADGQHII